MKFAGTSPFDGEAPLPGKNEALRRDPEDNGQMFAIELRNRSPMRHPAVTIWRWRWIMEAIV
jgi:hypothetical protein